MAHDEDDWKDAYLVLCVTAGIAAADAICCARLGRHAQGESHAEAVELLRAAHRETASHLSTLLGLKTKSAYGHSSASATDAKRAGRAAEVLVEAARRDARS